MPLSTAIERGLEPVLARISDTPAGVILETLFERLLGVYTLPAASTAIAYGSEPVVPRIVDTPAGVILETLFEL